MCWSTSASIKASEGSLSPVTPQPHYTQTWEVRVVTNYIRSIGANNGLSMQDLSHKLAMLMALTRPSRSADLANLDLKHTVELTWQRVLPSPQ